MPVNFFDEACREGPVHEREFGICDPRDGEKAFIDRDNRPAWIATVINNAGISLVFTAIDNCVEILRDDGGMEKRCDGMLTSDEHIVFLELKSRQKDWVSAAVEQLETTIRHFMANHDISLFSVRRAFACNNKHPQFRVVRHELKQRFYQQFKIRLNVQAVIEFH